MVPDRHSNSHGQTHSLECCGNSLVLCCCLLLSAVGCSRSIPRDGFILAQTPVKRLQSGSAVDVLDLRYPAGSRIVLADSAFKHLEVLSRGLYSAGDPKLSYDGRQVFFCAKSNAHAEWHIYELNLANRQYHPLTAITGGASCPELLPDGRLLFVSPVEKLGATNPLPARLYAQAHGQPPQALTFTTISVSDPTVLDDGRILFVGTRRSEHVTVASALYTINNDGTEVAQFSRTRAGTGLIRQPKQLHEKHICYLLSDPGTGRPAKSAEFIRCAQPFAAPECLSLSGLTRLGSLQPLPNGGILLSAQNSQRDSVSTSLSIYRVSPDTATPAKPIFSDPDWDCFETLVVSPRAHPLGRLSTVDGSKRTGQVLCLDVNYTATEPGTGAVPSATRVRVTARSGSDQEQVLGEVPVQPDGSFMAEVPADVPLGFDALDERGNLLRRVAPAIWVRPGENRSCIGCHEPPNHAPRNHRPLAVRVPVTKLLFQNPSLAKAEP